MKTTAILIVALSLSFLTQNLLTQSGWILHESGQSYWNLNSICFINTGTGFAAGNNGTFDKTTNGGFNWSLLNTGTNNNFNSVSFPSSNTGYIVGGGGVLVKTTNGGTNWNLFPAGTGYVQTSMFFINDNTGYVTSTVSGTSSIIMKTTNGGYNWLLDTTVNVLLRSVYFIDLNTGFAAGGSSSGGGIFKTTNGGFRWFTVNLIDNYSYYHIYICNNTIGYAVGTYGYIAKSTDGGNNWNEQYFGIGITLTSVFFVDINTGYSVGTGGTILKTTNGGINWIHQLNLATSAYLNDVWFTDANTGYAVGYSGTIIQTTTGGDPIGIKPISYEIPKTFILSQNYPNPFNPSTTIEFDIPMTSYTKLIVYDLLGKEIEILVYEELKAGSYRADFNADRLSSGVYYYKLAAGDFNQTRRMVVLK